MLAENDGFCRTLRPGQQNYSMVIDKVEPSYRKGDAMRLYIKDEQGKYVPATTKDILKEGRNCATATLRRGKKFISSSEEAKDSITSKLQHYQREVFGCLFLDSKHRILEWSELFFGTINSATVHPREVVKEALRLNAASVVFAHNHPSGSSEISPQDIDLTNRLTEILKIIDVKVLDHIVVGDTAVSFSDMGLMK
jgi:DNA repair protein RadC